jgi:hypothetical protein
MALRRTALVRRDGAMAANDDAEQAVPWQLTANARRSAMTAFIRNASVPYARPQPRASTAGGNSGSSGTDIGA